MEKVNVKEKLSLFQECWSPKIIGELLIEPRTTLNTGDVKNDRTVEASERI